MKKIIQLFLFVTIVNTSFAQYTLVKNFDNASTSTFSSSDSYDGFLANLGDKSFLRYDTTNTESVKNTLLSTITADGSREKIVSVPYRNDEYGPTFFDFKELPNDKMAFIVNASTGSTLFKIIITDGTTSGTVEVYSTTKVISGVEVIANGLYFTTQNATTYNYELMKIDLATNAVTQVVELGSFYPISDLSKTDENTLVFLATDATDENKLKLFTSDGTTLGTAPIAFIYGGYGVSQQTVMTKVGNKVFFFYKETGSDCCNFLWVTDGTTDGTTKLIEMNMISFTDYVRTKKVIAWNNKLYFLGLAKDETSNAGRVLWTSDGTESGTIPLNTSSTFYNPKNFTVFNNELYFIAYSATLYNNRLYKTDGTVLGTNAVSVTYNSTTLYPYEIATDNSSLYFAAYQNSLGDQMYKYNGTDLESTSALNSDTYSFSYPLYLNVNGADLYFTAASSTYGRELFTATFLTTGLVNGSSANSNALLFPNPASSNVEVQANKSILQLTLLDTQGTVLSSTTSSSLNIANYNAGMYYIRITFEDQTSSMQKLVIAK